MKGAREVASARPVGHDDARRPALTAVVASRDRPELLRDALGSLRSALGTCDRVIVVDSASRDGRVRDVASEAGADVIRCERPGVSRARNAALHLARTDIVAFTDDDCLPQPGWADAIVSAFTHDSHPAFVTGQVRATSAPSARATLLLSVEDAGEPRTLGAGSGIVLVGHGANMAWRRESLEAIGGFDEQLGPGTPLRAAEDGDVFTRALHAGLSGRYEPAAVVVHRQWRNRWQQLGVHYGYGTGAGALALKRALLERGTSGTVALAPSAVVRRAALGLAARYGRSFVRNVREGYEMGALGDVVTLAGSLRGCLVASRMALVEGRFRAAAGWARPAASAGAHAPASNRSTHSS